VAAAPKSAQGAARVDENDGISIVMQEFVGKIAVVTGASSGLGRAIAIGLARAGAKAIVLNYASNGAEADHSADLVRDAGAEPILVKADVADDAGCRAIARAAERFGRVDALFNNAGVTRFAFNHADLDALSADDFLDVYRVNVVGAYQMTRAALALLNRAPEPAAVVNVGSISALSGYGSSVAYAASKAALGTLTISLARALAPQVRVNVICPGMIDTPWFARGAKTDLDVLRERWRASTLLNVVSDANDIAEPAIFLASRLASRITGQLMVVDGGALLKSAT
jgi:NAD(P)-dependent dehydrogenase (short-subunit alcohol dehydrogenase family)